MMYPLDANFAPYLDQSPAYDNLFLTAGDAAELDEVDAWNEELARLDTMEAMHDEDLAEAQAQADSERSFRTASEAKQQASGGAV